LRRRARRAAAAVGLVVSRVGAVCRLWHGWTRPEDADAYEAYLAGELYPRIERELGGRGYLGFDVVRRPADTEVEFVTMTWFDSLASVQAFAGASYETPVLTETALHLLSRHDEHARHFELRASSGSQR
jgi:hypothetical protein